MKTIDSIFTNEIVIKNSRFITILFPLYEDNILEFVNKVKADYPKATHYCYAYVTEKHQKASDDGEPGGTAGLPMLNVLLKEEMLNVLAVTVRYFGGIKLGAGGLVRAYTKSVKEAIDNTSIIPVEKGYRISIKVMYNEQKSLDYICETEKCAKVPPMPKIKLAEIKTPKIIKDKIAAKKKTSSAKKKPAVTKRKTSSKRAN